MMGMRDLVLSPTRTVPAHCLSVSAARSGGPGGQKVNKVATKIDLRLDLTAAGETLGPYVVALLRQKLENRLDKDGNVQIIASEHRTQAQNLEAALARLETLMRDALQPVKPRRATRPTRGSVERRITDKKQRSARKRDRQNDW